MTASASTERLLARPTGLLRLRVGILFWVVLLLLGPVGAYWHTVTFDYGFRDDYAHLREVREEPGKLLKFTASNGRPVYGAVLEASLQRVYAVADLPWLRFGAVALLALAGLALWVVLRRAGWSELDACAAGLGLTLLPGSQVVASWAIAWPVALALALSIAGFAGVQASLEPRGRRAALALIGGGALCYLIAGLTYPPTALAAVVPLAGVLLGRRNDRAGSPQRWTILHLVVLFASIAAGFLLMKASFALGWVPESVRVQFETEPLSKLAWFVAWPVADSLALFALRDTFGTGATMFWAAAAAVAAIIALGFAADVRHRGKAQRHKWLVAVLALPFAAHAVSLAAAERSIGYRTTIALGGLSLTLLVYALRSLRNAGWIGRGLQRSLIVALISSAAALASYDSFTLIALPQAREWSMVRHAAQRLALTAATKVYIVTPTREDRSTTRIFSDEFGSLSSDSDWAPREMFKAAMRDRFRAGLPGSEGYTVTLGRAAPPAGNYDAVIDLRRLREARVDGAGTRLAAINPPSAPRPPPSRSRPRRAAARRGGP